MNDPRRWPDGVETYPADTQVLQDYEQARRDLGRFSVPLLVSRDQPNTRLFIAAFDGTGNDKHKLPDEITNVGVIADQIIASNRRNVKAGYVAGVGTQDGTSSKRLDGALGHSYGPRMEEMYLQFITQAKIWKDENPNADVSLAAIGFSRGAVTASVFTRMVHERGIQNSKDMIIERNIAGEIIRLTPQHSPLVPPGQTRQVLGLFDPVATGIMNLDDVRPAPSVVSGMQITAQHERRDMFLSKQILDPGISRDGRFYNFSVGGAHSNIGGGYLLDALAVRNGNMMAAFINATSDEPVLSYRIVPSAPEMNVIHRSEQHESFYSTKIADLTGRRGVEQGLSGLRVAHNPLDPEPADPALMQRTQYRYIVPPTETLDPSLPKFFDDKPMPSPQPPRIDSWDPLFRNMPMGAHGREANKFDMATNRPMTAMHNAQLPTQRWNPLFIAATDAALHGQASGIHEAGRAYAQSAEGQAWLGEGREHNHALVAQQAEQERQQALQEALAVQEAPARSARIMHL